MIQRALVFILFVLLHVPAFCQDKVYEVDMELRNTMIPQVNKAKKLIRENEYAKAVTILEDVIKVDSVWGEIYSDLFKACVLSNDLSDKVLDCFRKGKRIYSDDDEMCYFNAEIFRLRGNYVQAISLYSEAIKLGDGMPEKSVGYFNCLKNRAFCHSKLKKYPEAIADYSAYLKYRLDDSVVYINRGICYLNSGNKNKALVDFKKALELGNKNAQVYINGISK